MMKNIQANWDQISDMTDTSSLLSGGDQSMKAFFDSREQKIKILTFLGSQF